ncbi:hypothetical protein EVAR_25379_1 [Eumeta japonica]|uniref:Uncharacterized protein n=1 Tax=Eumeta variegata TaxID=151549 RepID=A0A4C1V4P4_EUMVA|nr:hypothetical protein EVAR_25379_1 [Eumeta japonica]
MRETSGDIEKSNHGSRGDALNRRAAGVPYAHCLMNSNLFRFVEPTDKQSGEDLSTLTNGSARMYEHPIKKLERVSGCAFTAARIVIKFCNISNVDTAAVVNPKARGRADIDIETDKVGTVRSPNSTVKPESTSGRYRIVIEIRLI